MGGIHSQLSPRTVQRYLIVGLSGLCVMVWSASASAARLEAEHLVASPEERGDAAGDDPSSGDELSSDGSVSSESTAPGVEGAETGQPSDVRADDSVPTGGIRVEAAPAIADANMYQQWVSERNPDIAEHLADERGSDNWISVGIAGTTYNYEVTVAAVRDGEVVETADEPISCECNGETLLDLIDGEIARALEQLHAPPPKPRYPRMDRRAELAEPSSEPEEEPSKRGENDRSRRVGPMGYAGIGLAVLGAGAAGTGVPFMFRSPDRIEVRGGPENYQERSMFIPGVAMAIGGGVALVTGVTMIAVDATRHRRRRVAVLPSVGPRFTGASLGLEF